MVDTIRLPIYESLNSSKKMMKGSFHALPIQNLDCDRTAINEQGFSKALNKIRNVELSLTGPFFDSLSDPARVIDESANIMKGIYGSDLALFVTCGSTIANEIVIDAICRKGDKVICQSGVHQSIHFSLTNSNADVNFINDVVCNEEGNIYRGDAEQILSEIAESSYKTLIINSQTYDGVCFDLNKFLIQVCKIGKSLENIIIDEAWGAWSTFDNYLKGKSGVHNSNVLAKKYKKNFIVVHSIHKSLFAFRQASMINVYGNEHCLAKIVSSHFKNHTTSPSYPILASTELATIHAKNFGAQYSQRSLNLVDKLKKHVTTSLSYFECLELEIDNEFFFNDPTKVWLKCNSPLLNGERVREHLFNNQGIYISRYSDDSVLLNFHYGITENILRLLLNGLEHIEKKIKIKQEKLNISVGETSNSFFILYPPGIPVISPGQKISELAINKISQSQSNNISLLVVEGN